MVHRVVVNASNLIWVVRLFVPCLVVAQCWILYSALTNWDSRVERMLRCLSMLYGSTGSGGIMSVSKTESVHQVQEKLKWKDVWQMRLRVRWAVCRVGRSAEKVSCRKMGLKYTGKHVRVYVMRSSHSMHCAHIMMQAESVSSSNG